MGWRATYSSLKFSALRRFPRAYFASLLRQEQRLPKSAGNPYATPKDDGEFENLDTLVRYSIDSGRVRKVSRRQERMAWLNPVIAKIDSLVAKGLRPSVHEVGCGSAVNLRLLAQIYDDRIELSGSDLSPIITTEFQISEWDINKPASERYDLVFSMGALCLAPDEQVAFKNIVDAAAHAAVLVEPVFDLSMPHQQAYLIRSGQKCHYNRLAAGLGVPFEAGVPSFPFSIKHASGFVSITKTP